MSSQFYSTRSCERVSLGWKWSSLIWTKVSKDILAKRRELRIPSDKNRNSSWAHIMARKSHIVLSVWSRNELTNRKLKTVLFSVDIQKSSTHRIKLHKLFKDIIIIDYIRCMNYQLGTNTHTHLISSLGAFAKLRKGTLSFRPPAWNNSTPNGSSWDLFLSIFRKSVERIKVSLKAEKSNEYITWTSMYIYDISLSCSYSEKCFKQNL